MRDPSHLLLAWNIDPTKEEGPGYVYDWREDWLVELANGAVENSHDIQWEVRADTDTDGGGKRPPPPPAARPGSAPPPPVAPGSTLV